MFRVIRAFVQALWLTIQGKQAAVVSRYPTLTTWQQEGIQRLQTVLRVADKSGWNAEQRKGFWLTLDSRKINAETILKATEHNLVREYPLLLATELDHTLTALYALNLNDRYRVGQLAQAEGINEMVQTALQALHAHLEAIPSSKEAV